MAGPLFANVQHQPQQLGRSFHLLGRDDPGHPQVGAQEVVDGDLGGLAFGGTGNGLSGSLVLVALLLAVLATLGRGSLGLGARSRLGCQSEQGIQLLRIHPLHQVLEGLDGVAGRQRLVHHGPREGLRQVQEGGSTGGRVWQHRRQQRDELRKAAQRVRADLMQLGGLCRILGQFPGLLGIDELVHPVGQRHDGAHCLGVVALLVQLGQGVGARPAFGKGRQRGRRGRCQPAVEALQDEAGRAAGDVDQLAHQIAVDPGHEILGVEVHVLDPAVELGRQVVAQPFRVHAQLQVLLRREARSARLGHLFAGDGEESVHEDVVGRVHAGKLQHGRPEQRVEVDDVLADEMHLTVRPLRILTSLRIDEGIEVQAALLAQRLQRGQVAHRGVQPHVEVLARRIRDGNAEVGLIARDVPVGQRVAGAFALGGFPIGCIAAQPFARLVGHLGLQPALRQPVVQELAAARIGEAEEVVLGAADDRRAAGQRGIGVDEVGGRVDLAADLAGVAVLVLGVTVGTLALDVAVRQEHFLHRIEELLDGARGHQARRLQPPVDLLRQRRVLG